MPEWTFISLDYELLYSDPDRAGTEVFVKSASTFRANSFGKISRASDQRRQRFFEEKLQTIAWHLGSDTIPVFIDFNGDRRRMDKGCIGHALAPPAFLAPPTDGPNGFVTHVTIAQRQQERVTGQQDQKELKSRVLEALKARGTVTVETLMSLLDADEKPVRSAIDRLRSEGQPIWNDEARGFWWRDDMAPKEIPYSRWKRAYVPE
ncbi:hypothetical protein LB515_02425 [Mesorhizobium sp. CA15]|uniref:hypothetical protein n=1 Tax=Mesorhizobium sp. CA15 TaxID=2876641 RepID=UPI001CD0FCD9|nr:hypothetical protein [Mesorhizobium sp. CA15]MBZ9864222.1 hypothetical protein [Mesorhizobium sp. CA15]